MGDQLPVTNDRKTQFDLYFRDHRSRMWRIARAYAPEAPDDLFQELALQLWQSLSRFEKKCELTTWAYRVHLNTAMSWRRNAARRRRLPVSDASTDQLVDRATMHAEIDSISLDERLRQLLASLGENDRAVLLLSLIHI